MSDTPQNNILPEIQKLFKYLVLMFVLATILAGCRPQRAELPNIVWLVSEDNSPLLGCYGDGFATTPNLDRLASQGVMYTRAFANAPVCAPARSTIITGCYASSLGTLPMRSTNPIPEKIKFLPEYLTDAGYYCTNCAKEDYNTVKEFKGWHESSREATYRNRPENTPFFHVHNFGVSHESCLHQWIPTEELQHDPALVQLPPYHPDSPEMRHDWAQYYDKVSELDRQIGEFLKGRIVSFVDLAPTMLSLAGIETPDYMQGNAFLGKYKTADPEYVFLYRGRMDERLDMSRAVRDSRFRYIRNYMPWRPALQKLEYLWRAPSMASWEKAYLAGECDEVQSGFFEPRPVEELYDTQQDPWEINNLAENTEYTEVLERMRETSSKTKSRKFTSGQTPSCGIMTTGRQGFCFLNGKRKLSRLVAFNSRIKIQNSVEIKKS